MHDTERVRARYRHFAEKECKGYCDHYFKLSHEIAGDDWLVDFISQMPETQPNLFLASLQFLTGSSDMPRSSQGARELVQANREEVERLMRSRRTQTNEPGRCATLLPALPRGPLALLEVGASAGLCLLLDEYAYDYGGLRLGPESSPVRLTCSITGNPTIPKAIPQVVWRAGLDRNPLNVHNEDDTRWLLSCVWSEHSQRRERLTAAIALARSRMLSLHRGDLVADLPGLLAEVPRNATLVVYHCAVFLYVNEEARRNFADILVDASRQRDIVWISNESPTVLPEITALAPSVEPSRFLLGRTWLNGGQRRDELLGIAHAHGAWLEWRLPNEQTGLVQ